MFTRRSLDVKPRLNAWEAKRADDLRRSLRSLFYSLFYCIIVFKNLLSQYSLYYLFNAGSGTLTSSRKQHQQKQQDFQEESERSYFNHILSLTSYNFFVETFDMKTTTTHTVSLKCCHKIALQVLPLIP